MSDPIDVIQTVMEQTENHKQEILRRLDEHKADIDRQFSWQDKTNKQLERRMLGLERTANHSLSEMAQSFKDLSKEIGNKVGKTEVFSTMMGNAMKSRYFWMGLVTVAVIVAPVIADHWHMLFARFGV